RSLNPAPLAGIKPTPQVVPQVSPAVGPGSRRRVKRNFFLWGRVYPGRRRWGRYRNLNLAPLAGIKPAPQVAPPVEPRARPGSGRRGGGSSFCGAGFYPGQWWWGRYRSLILAPLAGIKPAPQVAPPVEPRARPG